MRNNRKLTRGMVLALIIVCMVLQSAALAVPVVAEAPELAAVKATNLRVEYVINPIGIDVEAPRLSWVLESEARGVKQTGYRILVAESEAALASGPWAWDSGPVETDNTLGVVYGGDALKPTTRYFWTVIAETNIGQAVCDKGAFWETGFLDTTTAAWGAAQWISKPTWQMPAWQDVYSYTIEYDFQIRTGGSGFVFANSGNSYLMWQFNTHEVGGGIPNLRPHYWDTGGANMQNIDVSHVMPNTPAGKTAWYTVRLVVTGTTANASARITTYLGPRGGDLTVVDSNRNPGRSRAWPLSQIGFRQHTNGGAMGANNYEDANFTNIKIWDNTTVSSANNSAANLIFLEDFTAAASEWFPNLTILRDGGLNYVRVYNAADGARVLSSRPVLQPAPPAGINNEPLFRKEFVTKDQKIVKARLYATARGYYEFALNGKKVGDQYLAPGWSDYFHTIMYQTYDVTDMLKEGGVNAIGAMTGKGWYSGPHQMVGSGNYNLYGSVQSVVGKLVVTYADGSEDIIVTDNTWKYSPGPITYADNYRGEGYDARLDQKGWNDVGFNDSSWSAPLIVAAPGPVSYRDARIAVNISLPPPQIIGQVDPPIREVGRFTPVECTPAAYPNQRTWNVGQNISGNLTIRVRGNAGDRITIKHAEMLNTATAYREGGVTRGGGDGPPGTIFRASLRDSFAGGNQVAVDTYILKGDPEGEEWSPRFTFHGFQYFEITGNNVDIKPENKDRFEILGIEAIAISSDNEMLSGFESSHAKVNKLFANINWGMLGNQVGVPTDCPNRDERLGYTGDTQMFSRTATYLQNTNAFYSRWLRDLRSYQSTQSVNANRAGVVPMLIPNNPIESNFSNQWGSGWGDAATIVPWHMYQQYGDTQIIWDSYASMKGWCDFNYRSVNTLNNLRRASSGAAGWWNLGDWVNMDGSMPDDYKVITNSLFMAHSHNLFAKMARAIGDPYGEADAYEARAKAITEAIKASYFNRPGYEGKLTHADGSTRRERQTAYAMILYYNLDPDNNHIYAERLSAIINANGGRLGTGFVGVAYLTPALSANGYSDTAYTLLEQEAFPSWIYSINQGATTTWERWDSYKHDGGFDTSGMNSFNHYTFGSVGEWLMSGVLGIDRDESDYANAGFRKFLLNPQFGGTITYAKGYYDSVSGRIASDWVWNDNGKFEYKITVPANTSATVYIPSIGEDSAVLEGAVDAAKAECVTYIGYDAANQRAIYEVASGSYSFTSTTIRASKKLEITTNSVPNLYGGQITALVVDSEEPAMARVVRNSVPSSFTVPFGTVMELTAAPTNPTEFVFDGWYDADGSLISANKTIEFLVEGNTSVSAQFSRVMVDDARREEVANILNTILMPLANTALNSRITTVNEHANSGDWSRRNLINGNLIAVSGDNGWSSNDTGQNPAASRRPVITFDLGEPVSINRIHLYPRTDSLTASGGTGHFPVRFTIQLADNSGFTNAVTVVDHSEIRYPQPPVGNPAVFILDDTYTYRYMRITGIEMGERPADDTVFRMQFKQVGAYASWYTVCELEGCDYEGVVTLPTCTEHGFTTYTCTRCGNEYVGDEVEALGHLMGKPQPIPGDDDWAIKYCLREGCDYFELIPNVVETAIPQASVNKTNGNTNELTVTVTETYTNGKTKVLSKMFIIANNAAGTYEVSPYKVYVDTKGNIQIREIYIVK